MVIHSLRTRVESLVEKLEESHSLSVMCQALLTHYVESHWVPIAGLMEQIGNYAGCSLVTDSSIPEPCDLADAPVVLKGENESPYPSSLPSLESVSSSSINSVYYTPSFLQSSQGPTSITPPEVIPFVVQRRSTTPPTLSPSFSGDTESHWGQGVTYLVGKWWVCAEFVLKLPNCYPPGKCWANLKFAHCQCVCCHEENPVKNFTNQQKHKTFKIFRRPTRSSLSLQPPFLFSLTTHDAKRQNNEDIILVH